MKRWLIVMICFFTASGAANATQQTNWNHWRYFHAILTPAAERTALVRVDVPIDVFGHAQQDLADLRVVSDDGSETPLTIEQPQPSVSVNWRPVTVSDVGFVYEKYSQAVLDTGVNSNAYDTVRLDVDTFGFFTFVQVEASDDRSTWRIVRDKAPIFSFAEGSLTTLQIPRSHARWLRLKFLSSNRFVRLDSAQVAQQRESAPAKEPLPVVFRPNANSLAHQTWWQGDVGVADAPASAVHFRIGPGMFHRTVTISSSNDGTSWQDQGSGAIVREPAAVVGTHAAESLGIDFDQARGRYWRVAVLNGDDAPLQIEAVRLYMDPVYVVFQAQPQHSYRLMYGNSIAQPPQYDLSQITSAAARLAAPLVALAPERSNSDYVDPNPPAWSEQHGWILWLALGLTVAVLASLSIRALRRGVVVSQAGSDER